MRVDHNRSSYGAFPAFKRGFDSGFAALSARGANTLPGDRARKAALLLRGWRYGIRINSAGSIEGRPVLL